MRIRRRRHVCPTPPEVDRSTVRPNVHVGEGAQFVMYAHRTGDFTPMGWFTVAVVDADGTEAVDMTIHFADLKQYAEARERLGLREKIGGYWADGGTDDEMKAVLR